jgi:hypothetical protein
LGQSLTPDTFVPIALSRSILLLASVMLLRTKAKVPRTATVVFFHCLVNQYFLGWLLEEKDRSRAAPDS